MDAIQLLAHPEEILAIIRYKLVGSAAVNSKFDVRTLDEDKQICYAFLKQTSRSFYAVIMALDEELRFAVCIFYLVLRALDTVEDDMTIPLNEKIPLLKTFHEKLYEAGWNYDGSQEKDKAVLQRFDVISSEFRKLKPAFREVISDSCREMAEGMISFLDGRPIGSYAEWDEYCHYVAGIVGIGLSKLFSASGLEASAVAKDERLSNSMGLFLQKTNIIRDYLEDVNQNRLFWPNEAWSKYASKLHDFRSPEQLPQALGCLNELITNALEHIPDVLLYLSRLKNQSVFNFCAIPQVMAIATLERCYNNPDVFRRNVKIRKGEAVILIDRATTLESVREIFLEYSAKILAKIPSADQNAARTRTVLMDAFGNGAALHPASGLTNASTNLLLLVSLALIAWRYSSSVKTLYRNPPGVVKQVSHVISRVL